MRGLCLDEVPCPTLSRCFWLRPASKHQIQIKKLVYEQKPRYSLPDSSLCIELLFALPLPQACSFNMLQDKHHCCPKHPPIPDLLARFWGVAATCRGAVGFWWSSRGCESCWGLCNSIWVKQIVAMWDCGSGLLNSYFGSAGQVSGCFAFWLRNWEDEFCIRNLKWVTEGKNQFNFFLKKLRMWNSSMGRWATTTADSLVFPWCRVMNGQVGWQDHAPCSVFALSCNCKKTHKAVPTRFPSFVWRKFI